MKYISDPKYGSKIFDSAEECLRYEGACEAQRGAGCMMGMAGFLAFCALLLTLL